MTEIERAIDALPGAQRQVLRQHAAGKAAIRLARHLIESGYKLDRVEPYLVQLSDHRYTVDIRRVTGNCASYLEVIITDPRARRTARREIRAELLPLPAAQMIEFAGLEVLL